MYAGGEIVERAATSSGMLSQIWTSAYVFVASALLFSATEDWRVLVSLSDACISVSVFAILSKRSDVAEGEGWLPLASLSDPDWSAFFFGFGFRGFGSLSLRICSGETGRPASSAAVFWARLSMVSNEGYRGK